MITLPFPPASLSGHAKGHWSTQDIARLRQAYLDGLPVAQISESLVRTKAAIRNQAYKLGITTRDDGWSEAEISALRSAYLAAEFRGDLAGLIVSLGRSKYAISTKAAKLGLTDRSRPRISKPKIDKRKFKNDADRKVALSERMKIQHRDGVHPMLGKKHSIQVRQKISEATALYFETETEDQRQHRINSGLRTRIANHGSLAPQRPKASWKAGWREIGGKRNYYRSRWEANYARYLEWLKSLGEIKDWQHEPETFWFEAIKRGVRSYLPDFRVWESNGTSALHEVKGWMDARSKTTLSRMAKYHPGERVIVIREKAYRDITRKVGPMIPDWESSGRTDRP